MLLKAAVIRSCAVETEMKIEKGKVGLAPTNLKVEIPIGYELQSVHAADLLQKTESEF